MSRARVRGGVLQGESCSKHPSFPPAAHQPPGNPFTWGRRLGMVGPRTNPSHGEAVVLCSGQEKVPALCRVFKLHPTSPALIISSVFNVPVLQSSFVFFFLFFFSLSLAIAFSSYSADSSFSFDILIYASFCKDNSSLRDGRSA